VWIRVVVARRCSISRRRSMYDTADAVNRFRNQNDRWPPATRAVPYRRKVALAAQINGFVHPGRTATMSRGSEYSSAGTRKESERPPRWPVRLSYLPVSRCAGALGDHPRRVGPTVSQTLPNWLPELLTRDVTLSPANH